MYALILWLEDLFRQRRDAMACLTVSLLPLPLFCVFLIMPMIAQTSGEWANLYRQERVVFTQIVLALDMLALLVIARRAWKFRNVERDLPMLCLMAVFTVFSAVIVLSLGYGYKDSPLMLLCMGMLILVRAMFKPFVYKPVFIAMSLLFIVSEIAFWTNAIPYAPLLQHPIYTGEQLNDWWGFWLRIIYTMITLPMIALFFMLAHIMVRERRELESLVRTDALTGLLNRRAFMEKFDIEIARHARKDRPLCLLMLDVDHFKKVNDHYGHPAGDSVLEALGNILEHSTRRNNDVAARFGGEEFVVLLPDTELEQAGRIAEHIGWQMRVQSFGRGKGRFSATVSIGVVQVEGVNVDLALRCVDDNLYLAKNGGRDRVVASVMEEQEAPAETA